MAYSAHFRKKVLESLTTGSYAWQAAVLFRIYFATIRNWKIKSGKSGAPQNLATKESQQRIVIGRCRSSYSQLSACMHQTPHFPTIAAIPKAIRRHRQPKKQS